MSDSEFARRTLRWVIKQAARAALQALEIEAAQLGERAAEAARGAAAIREWLA